MKRFRWMAMVLVGVILFAVSSSAFAAVKGDTVSPFYLYTRRVNASLSISDSGKATCSGYVKANSSGGSISITITLYRQSGKSWSKVTSWSVSGTSQILDIEKNKQVTEGTYKVVLTGSVTNPEGKKEEVKTTSTEMTYSNTVFCIR